MTLIGGFRGESSAVDCAMFFGMSESGVNDAGPIRKSAKVSNSSLVFRFILVNIYYLSGGHFFFFFYKYLIVWNYKIVFMRHTREINF